jgi:glutamate-1-semialdehyde 2,1-aminomutase
LVMVAGNATLDVLDQPAIDTLNQLAAFLKQGLQEAMQRRGIHGQITGAGSILNVHFAAQPVVDYRSASTDSDALTRLLHLMLLERGIFIAKRGMFNISTPMSSADIKAAVEAFDDCLEKMQPAIANDMPGLLH